MITNPLFTSALNCKKAKIPNQKQKSPRKIKHPTTNSSQTSNFQVIRSSNKRKTFPLKKIPKPEIQNSLSNATIKEVPATRDQISQITKDSSDFLKKKYVPKNKSPEISKNRPNLTSNNTLNSINRKRTSSLSLLSLPDITTGKINYTDFWSVNMKKEVIKMGRIDVLISYGNTSLCEKKNRSFSPYLNSITDIETFQLNSSGNDIKLKKNVISHDFVKEIDNIVEKCNCSRNENKILRKNISKTRADLKNDFNNFLSLSTPNIKYVISH